MRVEGHFVLRSGGEHIETLSRQRPVAGNARADDLSIVDPLALHSEGNRGAE